jgi:hypothetical protein
MDNRILDILKWIGIALAAGFVGYFGRYLAMLIIAKVHKKESKLPSSPEHRAFNDVPISQDSILEQSKLKVEKKKSKAEAKKAKKEQKN